MFIFCCLGWGRGRGRGGGRVFFCSLGGGVSIFWLFVRGGMFIFMPFGQGACFFRLFGREQEFTHLPVCLARL